MSQIGEIIGSNIQSIMEERGIKRQKDFVEMYVKHRNPEIDFNTLPDDKFEAMVTAAQPGISILFNGHKTPSIEMLIDVADILDCSIDELLGRKQATDENITFCDFIDSLIKLDEYFPIDVESRAETSYQDLYESFPILASYGSSSNQDREPDYFKYYRGKSLIITIYDNRMGEFANEWTNVRRATMVLNDPKLRAYTLDGLKNSLHQKVQYGETEEKMGDKEKRLVKECYKDTIDFAALKSIYDDIDSITETRFGRKCWNGDSKDN